MAKRKPITYVLWTIQILLALLFIWGGAFKLVAPIEKLAGSWEKLVSKGFRAPHTCPR